MITNKTAAIFIFLCPTAYSMRNTQEISNSLVIAARNCDIATYRHTVNEAIQHLESLSHYENDVYSEFEPTIAELRRGVTHGYGAPDILGHTVAIGYGVATNNRLSVTSSVIRTLLTIWCVSTNPPNQSRIAGIGRYCSCYLPCITLSGHLAEAVATRSLLPALNGIIDISLQLLPVYREDMIYLERERLTRGLNEIESHYKQIKRERILQFCRQCLSDTTLSLHTRQNILHIYQEQFPDEIFVIPRTTPTDGSPAA